MQNGIFITGTDTHVGKTWVGQQLIRELRRRGVDVIPRKPVESGWTENSANNEETDAWKLANAAGIPDKLSQVCPFHFEAAISPVRAARLAHQKINVNQLKQHCLSHIKNEQFLLVEGAGGFYSPLVEDALNADFATQLGLPVLLVAEDRVGCINQILLTIEAATNKGLRIIAIYLNRIKSHTDTLMNNQEDLAAFTHIPVVTNIHNLSDLLVESALSSEILL